MRSKITRCLLLALVAMPFAVPQAGHAVLGAELAPNRGFENSPTDPSGDLTRQPLLPTDWGVEGLAGLFDHSENVKHSGRRSAAISIPVSTPRNLCAEGTCQENPVHVVDDEVDHVATVSPCWRTLRLNGAVTAGTVYTFSYWVQLDFATVRVGGATSKVRWLDVNGVPIRDSAGPSRIQQPSDGVTTAWEQMTRNMTAPAGSKSAVLLLCAADDLWISQTRFDDVSFRPNI